MMTWIGVPTIKVRVKNLKTRQVISQINTVLERPLTKTTTI